MEISGNSLEYILIYMEQSSICFTCGKPNLKAHFAGFGVRGLERKQCEIPSFVIPRTTIINFKKKKRNHNHYRSRHNANYAEKAPLNNSLLSNLFIHIHTFHHVVPYEPYFS